MILVYSPACQPVMCEIPFIFHRPNAMAEGVRLV
ncbi:hypothetical protein, partial [Salinibacter phage M31CC-1]